MAASAFREVQIVKRPFIAITWFVLWLLFLPNAPYIVTDLIHLRPRDPIPLWYDLMIFSSCAGTGLLLGYMSLMDVQTKIEAWLGARAGWVMAIGSLSLSGFGIYIGRFLRWNSWEAFTNPVALIGDLASKLLNPHSFVTTVGVTVVYGIALTLGYLSLRIAGATDPLSTIPASSSSDKEI